jgi:hypothetical protein
MKSCGGKNLPGLILSEVFAHFMYVFRRVPSEVEVGHLGDDGDQERLREQAH